MSVSSDIPVQVINEAKITDVKVVVFTKNASAPESYYVAWQVLTLSPAMTEAFTYPAETSIEARWSGISLRDPLLVGPVPAEPGSTWEIFQPEEKGTPALQQVISEPINPDNAIVVRNVKPSSWSGREYSVGVIKGSKKVMYQGQIPVGDQAVFVLKPILHFGVTRSDKFIPQMFKSSEIAEATDAQESFDLSNYPNGMKVTLKESADRRYTFKGENI